MRVHRDVLGALWLTSDPLRFGDHLYVCTTYVCTTTGEASISRTTGARRVNGEPAHRVGDQARRAAVDSTVERE